MVLPFVTARLLDRSMHYSAETFLDTNELLRRVRTVQQNQARVHALMQPARPIGRDARVPRLS